MGNFDLCRRANVTVTITLCVLGWLAGWIAMGRPRRFDDLRAVAGERGRDGLRGVTIVIPARDEEASIDMLLSGLCDRSSGVSGPDRLVVVDDHSRDRTAALAGAHRGVEVLDAPPLPDGWTGKSWACHVGAAHVAGSADVRTRPDHGGSRPASSDDDVLVFLDADVQLDRASLARVVAQRDRQGGLVSVQPWHETERWYEQLSCLFNVLAVMGTAAGSRGRANGAFGPVLVTSRSDYARVGGHGSVRTEVIEDLALAARYRSAEMPVELFTGARSIRFRMYPGGPRQLAEGWTKNFAAGAGSTRPGRLAVIVLWVTCLGSATLALDDALRGDIALPVGLALYLAFAAQLMVMFRQVGNFSPLTALAFPISLVFFGLIFCRSLWRTHVRHSVTWRGREISTVPDRG